MQMNQQAQNKIDDQMDYNMNVAQDHGNVPMDVAEDVVMQSAPAMFWFTPQPSCLTYAPIYFNGRSSYRIFLIVKLIQIRLIKIVDLINLKENL